MDYPITAPTAPGVYTSEALGETGTLTINEDGTALTSSVINDTTYSHAIIGLAAWSKLFGPFRELDGGTPEDPTEPDPAAPELPPVEPLAEWEQELLASTSIPAIETSEEDAA